MVYLYEIRCDVTNEVYYGARTETIVKLYKRLQHPNKGSPLGRLLDTYGPQNFTVNHIATYMTQAPAVEHANKLIAKAEYEGRSLNDRPLRASNIRNAKR